MQIIQDRRALHRIPELDWAMEKTGAYLKTALEGLNCQIFSPLEGALCAFFDFGAEKALAFRSDTDALPIAEQNAVEYISCHPGIMHACGHDGHMAILLELARRLSQKADNPWNILLVFQPGEECTGGAERICNTGIFEKYNVEAVFGLHLWPGPEKGQVFSRENELMARASEVNVDVYGKSAHIAKASQGIDAIAAGAEFFRRAMGMEAALPKHIFRLLKFGKFESGTVRNALSAHTHMEGSLRAFQDTVFDGLREGLYTIARELESEYGCRIEIDINTGYPAVMNPPQLCRRVKQAVEYRELDAPFMTAEDFAFYQRRLPSVFFFLGTGDSPALHTSNFDFDETILKNGADFFEKLATEFV